MITRRQNKIVLVGVLKSKQDQRILLTEHWYRIPVAFLPKRKFRYLAFYQPAAFGKSGKRIEYYGRTLKNKTVKRIDLLPKESSHPRAHDDYVKIELVWVRKLPRPIKNIIPRRVSFGFTSLKLLLNAKDILELYGVPATEKIIENGLRRRGIKTQKEFTVSAKGKRYRLDLAVFCRNGSVAIECDNDKAHSTAAQKNKDMIKDTSLQQHGWRVVRLRERDIIERLDRCLLRVEKVVKSLAGLAIKS